MSIKSMVFYSGCRLSMTHCSDNGLVFAERFRNFAKSENVFKAEYHKAWEENICLKEEESNEEHGSFNLCTTGIVRSGWLEPCQI